MIIERIKTLMNVWFDHTRYTLYKTTIDDKTQKETTQVIVYQVYNHKGQVESNEQQSKINVKV
jgi:hypothetical protein